MNNHPSCSDRNKMYEYEYCGYDYMCFLTENARQARHKSLIDSITGDVCNDVTTRCPC